MEESIDREWNYYFNIGDEVMLDDEVLRYDNINLPFLGLPKNIKPLLYKRAIVLECTSDFHAFGRGSAYGCEIQFDDETILKISTRHLVKYDSNATT